MDNMLKEEDKLHAIVLGIIFDPKKKKILIGRRKNNPTLKKLSWSFPGGRLRPGDEVDKALKKHVKEKTGYNIKNLGAIFSNIYSEKKDLLAVYFLTQIFDGKEKPGSEFIELKWVNPKELEKYFTTSFNKKLKQYLIDLI
ncbi:MAG: NUDIX hydrolase [archaeon]